MTSKDTACNDLNLPTTSKKRRKTTNKRQILTYNTGQSVLLSNTFSTQYLIAIIRELLHRELWQKENL